MKKLTLFLSVLLIARTIIFANPPKTTSTKKTTAVKVTKPVTTKPQVAADALKIENNNKEEEIIVDSKDVLVSGSNNKLTITGNVGKIFISGKDNDITIVTVNEIIITGNGNFVSWEKSNNSNAKPMIQDKGGYNNVEIRSGNAQPKFEN